MLQDTTEPEPAVTPSHPLLHTALLRSLAAQSVQPAQRRVSPPASPERMRSPLPLPSTPGRPSSASVGHRQRFAAYLGRLRSGLRLSPLVLFLSWTALQSALAYSRCWPSISLSSSLVEDIFLLTGVLAIAVAEGCAATVAFCIYLTAVRRAASTRSQELHDRRVILGYTVIGVLAALCAVFTLRILPAQQLPAEKLREFSVAVDTMLAATAGGTFRPQ